MHAGNIVVPRSVVSGETGLLASKMTSHFFMEGISCETNDEPCGTVPLFFDGLAV
jgi:hypothetical protein